MQEKYLTANELLEGISPMVKGYVVNTIAERLIEANDFLDSWQERCDETLAKQNEMRNLDVYVSSGFCESFAPSNQPFKITKLKTNPFGNHVALLGTEAATLLVKRTKKPLQLPSKSKYKKKLASGNRFSEQHDFLERQCIMNDFPYFIIVNFTLNNDCLLREVRAIVPDANYGSIQASEDWLEYKSYNLLKVIESAPSKSVGLTLKKREKDESLESEKD